MTKVFANGRSILHAGDGLKHTAAAPDVCKTPSPGGPIPVPYVNVASNSDLAKGTTTVHIEGNSVALANSNLSTSMGDEPGTAGGGLVSSKNKGKLTWGSSSIDVKFEGKGVVRFMDVTQHNGNSFNTAFISAGGTGFAYGDDFKGACPICEKNPDSHAVLDRPEGSLDTANQILKDLKACEDAWAKANKEIEAAVAKLDSTLRKDPNIKPETVAKRRADIEALEAKRKGLEGHRRANSSGYMFGVMVCLTGQKFAAVSGNEMPAEFEAIARKYGCEPLKEAATLEDLKAINPRCAKGDPAAIATMTKQWRDTMTQFEEEAGGYSNRPGTCAGAKLMGKSRHVAHSMTEIYFSFTGGRKALTFNVIYRGPTHFAPTDGPWTPPSADDLASGKGGPHVEKRGDMRRKKELTVPSCQSCQDTLFMARCDIEKQSCA
jgi:hypothetical protein